MTFKEKLYSTAVNAKALQEESRQERHLKLVHEYLESLCIRTAIMGKFKVYVTCVNLNDGLPLTIEEIKKFATVHNLDYKEEKEKRCLILCFGKNS